ncbi:hypothetical protein DL96DRAFT_479735 [Flagelloscypha sp. PMI_526]|nr:hypothetical protein DL96DRAFT_479735 [Flagelloscypha sp. PMI_526]
MNLFFTPHDPEACLISTATDVSCYFVDTHILTNGRYITSIKRPEASQAEALVAEISWRCWGEPTMVRCPLVKKGFASFPSAEFLYKKHHFRASTSRYFMANDGVEYCWRRVKGAGFVASNHFI